MYTNSDNRGRTVDQERLRNRGKQQRYRARRTLWRMINRYPGLTIGELMKIGRDAELVTAEMWPRELRHLLADGDVISIGGQRTNGTRDVGLLHVTDRPNRYRREVDR